MGLIGGLGSFFALLAGEPLVESSFPADWELKTKPYSGDATLPADADGKGSKGKKGKGGKAADPVLELTPAERKRLIERGASELLILLDFSLPTGIIYQRYANAIFAAANMRAGGPPRLPAPP